MRKGLKNPNSIAAVNELKLEIASELGITNREAFAKYKYNRQNAEINKKLVEKSRNNLIGFK